MEGCLTPPSVCRSHILRHCGLPVWLWLVIPLATAVSSFRSDRNQEQDAEDSHPSLAALVISEVRDASIGISIGIGVVALVQHLVLVDSKSTNGL